MCACSVDAMSVMNETENVEVLQLVNTSTVHVASADQLNMSSVSSTAIPQTGQILSSHCVCICFVADILIITVLLPMSYFIVRLLLSLR